MTDENRTHGADSAIDDEMIPPAPAGMDAIGDIPDKTIEGMPLAYDLQTFNALVAANTAMQTEISSMNERMGLLMEQRDSFKTALADTRSDAQAYLAQIKDLQAADADNRKRMDVLREDFGFATETAAVTQRRLDRALGYLDRTLDEDDRHSAPATHTVPAPRPPVGPNFDGISFPVRRQAGDNNWMYATGERVEPIAGAPRRHR